MKKEEILKLRKKLEDAGGKINEAALLNQFKDDPKATEKTLTEVAKFLGVKK